jgi:hypothetical protein
MPNALPKRKVFLVCAHQEEHSASSDTPEKWPIGRSELIPLWENRSDRSWPEPPASLQKNKFRDAEIKTPHLGAG